MTRSPLRFEKWEGLGNDFIVVDDAAMTGEVARALCDRRRGIGADGVLVVTREASATPRMIVYNADGSRPEMCGNGLRCVAARLADATAGSSSQVVLTDAGERRCAVQATAEGRFAVTIEMGVARIDGDLDVALDGRGSLVFRLVDMGNPHAITFEPVAPEDVDRIAPRVEIARAGGVNVEFCRIEEGAEVPRIDVVVWERGVGRTLACGTGACAVAALVCATGRAPYDRAIRVALPGGELAIVVDRALAVTMTGPARRVFRGEVTLS